MQKKQISHIVGEFPVLSETWLQEKILNLYNFCPYEQKVFSLRVGTSEYDSRIRNVVYLSIPLSRLHRKIKSLYLLFLCIIFRLRDLRYLFKNSKKNISRLLYTDLFYYDFFKSAIKESNIIHCHFGMVGNKFLNIEKAIGSMAKVIVSFYGQDVDRYPKLRGKSYYDYLKNRAVYIVAMTDYMKLRLAVNGFDEDKIIVIRPGVDTEKYVFNQRFFNKEEVFRIISVGRITEKKGFDDLIRAVKIIVDCGYSVDVKIAGGYSEQKKDYYEHLLKLRNDLGLNSIIDFLGPTDHDEVLRLISKSHLMVQMSKTDHEGDTEGLPYVILEGASTGIPIVASRHAGIPEGVLEGESAILVDEGDYSSAAREIISFVSNPEKVEKFSLSARKFTVENYDIKIGTKKTIELYSSLL